MNYMVELNTLRCIKTYHSQLQSYYARLHHLVLKVIKHVFIYGDNLRCRKITVYNTK